MNLIVQSNAKARQAVWLTMLLAAVFWGAAEARDKPSADATSENYANAPIRIVDQYGRQASSGKRYVGSQIFDVIVGPVGNELSFVPDTINISVGDTVRWTWESNFHSVTSGDPTTCNADGQFCSPDNMNCDAGILNNTGFVYEFTFTQPGMYQYFCAVHCFAGMTGVVTVMPAVRPLPTPRPRPTPAPRP
jgi:plastocyanin